MQPSNEPIAVRPAPARPTEGASDAWDLLRLPLVGRFLHWRHARTALQVPLALLSIVMILDGFLGSPLAPKNTATVLTWVHYRGVLVLTLLAAGNLFCMACPFMLPRNIARRIARPPFRWPRMLRNKWTAIVLTVAVLFAYERYDLWGEPVWTAALIAGYFIAALAVDGLFRHASFCKHVCPIGQFNFLASTASPLEVRVRDHGVCATCGTFDCIRGRPAAESRPAQRGCELLLFQPRKVGNMDCTFCLDCVHACPHDNVGIMARLPASELFDDPPRSGIGRFSRRADLAVLGTVFTFGALLNAFGMVSPVYAFESWLARALHTTSEGPVLGAVFFLVLVIEPALLLGATAWWSVRWGGGGASVLHHAVRCAYALVPLGLGVWTAHYAFHFLTGAATIVPVTQNLLAGIGWPVLGHPDWRLSGMSPKAALPIEVGLLGLGLVYSLTVLARIAMAERPGRARSLFIPWATLHLLLAATAIWLLRQPMEMRGTVLGG